MVPAPDGLVSETSFMSDAPHDEPTSGHPSAHLRPAAPHEAPAAPPLSAVFPTGASIPHDRVSYGPDIPDESTYRLLGNVDGKRVLELGSGAGQAAVAMAKQGAHVISVDRSHHRLELVRTACEREEVKVELHQSDPAELAFVRADTIDVVLSVFTLATVEDLDRVFRQVHRVLRTECPLVFSVPHPAYTMITPDDDPRRLARRYFDRTPRPLAASEAGGAELEGVEVPRTISEIFTSLVRANFRIDTLIEPEPAEGRHSSLWTETMAWVPATLVIRARKEGI